MLSLCLHMYETKWLVERGYCVLYKKTDTFEDIVLNAVTDNGI